jgi:predicted SprT family Zn-dependent metalloprotease
MRTYKEIVEDNRQKFDLDKLFNEINKKAFNNSIDKKMVTLRWSKAKKVAGLADPRFKKDGSLQKVIVSLSHMFDFDLEHITRILAHEMIHVKLFIQGTYEYDDHGSYFKGEAKRISSILGVKITIKHEAVSLASKTKGKEIGYVLIQDKNRYAAALFTVKAYNDLLPHIPRLLPQLTGRGETLTHGITTSTLGNKYALKRSTKGFNLYDITDEEAKELL